MSIIGLFTALVLMLLVLAVMIAPLMMKQDESASSFRSKQRERALAYYERVLRNIRDLDDDLATGKIMQAEYDLERERWLARGVEILQMIDQLDHAQNIAATLPSDANDAEIDAVIEQAVAEVRDQIKANEAG